MNCNYKRPRHKYDKALAQKICKKMGIGWSETAESPTLCGVLLPGEYFGDIFRGSATETDKEGSA